MGQWWIQIAAILAFSCVGLQILFRNQRKYRLIVLTVYTLIALYALLGLAQAATVLLAWDYNTPNPDAPAATFSIYRQSSCIGPFTVVQTQAATQLTWTDTQVTPGLSYCWQVTAVSAAGKESEPSNVLQFQVPQPSPAPPSNLRVGP